MNEIYRLGANKDYLSLFELNFMQQVLLFHTITLAFIKIGILNCKLIGRFEHLKFIKSKNLYKLLCEYGPDPDSSSGWSRHIYFSKENYSNQKAY